MAGPPLPPALPNESAEAYRRRHSTLGLQHPTLVPPTYDLTPVGAPSPPEHHLSETTKIAFTLGRTVAIVGAVFYAGWIANTKVGEVLGRQAQLESQLHTGLVNMLTKSDLAEMEARVERHLVDRLSSRGIIASCPVLTVRGQSHKPCEILGLTEPRPPAATPE